MSDRRRRPKRGVRLSDLPDDVVRDLGELVPEQHGEPVLMHRDGRVKRSGSIKVEGFKPLHDALESLAGQTKAAVTKAIDKAVKGTAAQILPRKKSRRQMAADEFAFQLRAHGFEFEREVKFAKDDSYEARLWRFDFLLRRWKLAIEIEGLVVRMVRDINSGKPMTVVTGRHATVTGMREDFHKYAAAEIMGYHVIRVEQDMIRQGDAIAFVERFVARRKWELEQQKPKSKATPARRRAAK